MSKLEQRLRKKRTIGKQERLEKKRGGKLLCEGCGKFFLRRELTEFDPFQEEVYNERVPCRLCPDCAEESSRDV